MTLESISEEHLPKGETEDISKLKQSTKTQEYIVCLVCEIENDEGFALYPTTDCILNSLTATFRPDLDVFCGKLKVLLTEVLVLNNNADSLKDHLAGWFTYTVCAAETFPILLQVEYMARVQDSSFISNSNRSLTS